MKKSEFDFQFSIFNFQFKKLKIPAFLLFILSLIIASAGCTRRQMPALFGQNYPSQPSKNLSIYGTVCLVELHNNTVYPQISGDVTETLYQTLQKKNLSGLSLLRQNEDAWKNLQIRPDSPHTLEQLLATRKMLGVDSVLIGTVTSFTPYPRMAIGLNLKLIDLRDGHIAWAVEKVWDTSDKATEQRIKKYFDKQIRSDFTPLDEKLAIFSTINFVRFVTYDATETLGP